MALTMPNIAGRLDIAFAVSMKAFDEFTEWIPGC
jgi:multidrug transporter EmrE-like cation transporter